MIGTAYATGAAFLAAAYALVGIANRRARSRR